MIFSVFKEYYDRNSKRGTKYARVFPLPVSDFSTTFLLARITGIEFFYMFVSSSKLFSLSIYFSLSLTGSSSNLSPAKTSASSAYTIFLVSSLANSFFSSSFSFASFAYLSAALLYFSWVCLERTGAAGSTLGFGASSFFSRIDDFLMRGFSISAVSTNSEVSSFLGLISYTFLISLPFFLWAPSLKL